MIKVRYELDNGRSYIAELDESQNFLPNFTFREAANNKANDVIKLVINSRFLKFANMIQQMRNHFGKMEVNSWYRTESFNSTLTGADKNSCHLRGLALDWNTGILTNTQLKERAEYWKMLCEQNNEIGAVNYYSNRMHLEIASDEQYGAKTFSVRDYRGKEY